MFNALMERIAGTGRELRGTVAEIKAALEKARQRREEIKAMWPPKAEVIEHLHRYIDRRADEFPHLLFASMGSAIQSVEALDPANLGRAQEYFRGGLTAPHGANWLSDGKHPIADSLEASLFYVHREDYKKAVARAISEMEWWSKTMPGKQRAGELNKVEEEIRALETQHKAIVKEEAELLEELYKERGQR